MVTWESAGEPVHPAYCSSPKDLTMIGSAKVPKYTQHVSVNTSRRHGRSSNAPVGSIVVFTGAGGIQWLHVEDINAVHLSENLKTLKTGGLLKIGWDRSNWGSWWEEIGIGLDLCSVVSSALAPNPCISHCASMVRGDDDDIPLKFFIGAAGTSYLPSAQKVSHCPPKLSPLPQKSSDPSPSTSSSSSSLWRRA